MDEKGTGKIPDHKGLGWRVSLSIISGVGWLCFIILWLAFFAGDHSAYRNLAVLLASIMLIGGILGLLIAGQTLNVSSTIGLIALWPGIYSGSGAICSTGSWNLRKGSLR